MREGYLKGSGMSLREIFDRIFNRIRQSEFLEAELCRSLGCALGWLRPFEKKAGESTHAGAKGELVAKNCGENRAQGGNGAGPECVFH
jgi:hypothetical protein